MKKILLAVLATTIAVSYSTATTAAPLGQSGQSGANGLPSDPSGPDQLKHTGNGSQQSQDNSYEGGISHHSSDFCALMLQNPWIPHEIIPCWADSLDQDRKQ